MVINRYTKLLMFFLLAMSIFSLARLAIFILYHDQFASYETVKIISAFIGGIRFDASIFMTVTAPFWLLLFLPIHNMRYQKNVLWAMFPVYIFCALVLVIDVIYYGFVSRHLTNEPFLMGNDISFIIDILPSYIWQLLLFIFVIIGCGFFWRTLVNIKISSDIKNTALRFLVVLLLIGGSYIIIRGNVDTKPIAIIDAYNAADVHLGNLKINGFFSTVRYLDDDNIAADVYNFYDNVTAENILKKTYNKSCDKSALKGLDFKNSNVVLIMLESVSSRYVDSFFELDGGGGGLTPKIDNLSKTAIKFINHYSVNKRSITSIQAALTGVPPINGLPYLGFGLESYTNGNLGTLFEDAGYDTIFTQASRRRSYYLDSISQALGFASYYGMEDTQIVLDYPDKHGASFGWDYETFMLLADKIDEQYERTKKPFLAFIFTGTTHEPYGLLPKQFMKFEHGSTSEGGYKNTLIYADWSLGEFIKKMKNKEYFNDTIFVITADHSARAQDLKYPQDFWIPLIIYSPKFKKSVEINNVTSHSDLSQTIADIVGVRDDINGDSLFCKDVNSTAMLFHGGTVGLVTHDGYLNHSLQDVLDYNLPDDNSSERIENLSNYIKAYHQLIYNSVMESK